MSVVTGIAGVDVIAVGAHRDRDWRTASWQSTRRSGVGRNGRAGIAGERAAAMLSTWATREDCEKMWIARYCSCPMLQPPAPRR